MAALVVMGTMAFGCDSVEDLPVTEPTEAESRMVTLTTTISIGDGNAQTRALDAAGQKTFAEGDQIAVVYENTSGTMVKADNVTLTAADITDGGKKATITVTLTDPKASGTLRYIYPAAMAKSNGDVNYAALKTQDGTLATLAANLDLALYEGALTATADLPAGVKLTNPLCIGEFNIINSGDITGNITMMTVFDGTNAYIVNRTPAAGPIYVAMQPVASDKTLQFCATDGTTSYRKHVAGKALSAGNMYPVNLTMPTETRTSLELLTSNHTAKNGETLTGVLLGNYKIQATNTVTLDGVDINTTYPVSFSGAGIGCSGNTTLILADGSDNKVTAGKTNKFGYAGICLTTVNNNYTLTIRGNGSLTATGKTSGKNGGAGIGGQGSEGDNILIEGGTITAKGGTYAAGIGCGYQNGSGHCGNITITGGNVTAIGGTFAAGIGAGNADGGNNICGTILISGGTVSATGGIGAAGIGSGNVYKSSSNSDSYYTKIVITTGVTRVTATKGSGSPCSIGCGKLANTMRKVYIGCTLDADGKPVGDPTGMVSDSPYTYQP